MDVTHELDEQRFARLAHFLAGEAGPEERAEVEAWLAADPRHRELLRQVRRVLDESAAVIAEREAGLSVDVEAALARVRTFSLQPARRALSPVFKIAAAILLVAGGALAYRMLADTARPPVSTPVAMRELSTPRGQRSAFRLPDGTRVILNAESRLRVPADYGVTSRDLFLDGEGYFEVTHDSTKRFIVHTATAITEDLGTRFGVRAYAGERATGVVVAEGRVAVQPRAAEGTRPGTWLLARGQAAEVTAGGAVAMRDQVDADRLLAWTEGRLVFDNTPLRDAVARLERWYDVDIRLADSSVGDRRFTAVFRHEGVSEVFRLLALSLDLRVERAGSAIVLRDAVSPRRR